MHPQEALKHYFGFESFLDGQLDVVEKILDGQDLCVVMPTGAGKSLCYQLPILMGKGYGLVVSPLISLMKDQVDALCERSIPAAYVNSTISPEEQRRRLWATGAGEIKILYVAPERFRAPAFRRLLNEQPPDLLVVDEAHCISQWGHDFRPDYLRLGEAVAETSVPQVCAFTATATPLVREDIRTHLKRADMGTYVSGFQRPNLSFSVLNCRSNQQKQDAVANLLQDPQPTIIYASTRKAVDQLASEFGCIPYHAGLRDEERTSAQNRFMADPCPVLAATNAFGMGIDRPDIRRVVHYNIPGSLEAYYQEAGRAGRDGEPADCILLFAYHDRFVQEFLIDINNPSEALLRTLYGVLRKEFQRAGDALLELRLADLAAIVPGAESDRQLSSALRILESHGYVERGFRRENQGTLQFLRDLDGLHRLHQHQGTQRSRFIDRCIQYCGQPLRSGVALTYEQLAGIAGLRVDQIQRVLRALHGEEVAWTPPFSGRALQLPKPEESELNISFEELNKKRDFDFARLEDVINYTRSTGCRQRFIVAYFGQDIADWRCEACDLCRKLEHALHRDPTPEETEIIRSVLQAVLDFEGRFGKGRIAQVLAGSKSQEIVRWRLDSHPRYGDLADVGNAHLLRFLNSLQKSDCIKQVGDPKYPCIDISPFGINVLDGKEAVKLDFPEEGGSNRTGGTSKSPRKRKARSPKKDAAVDVTRDELEETADDLFERLRGVRLEMADDRGAPAYVILSDRALAGLAEAKPITAEEALRIKGIGPKKVDTIIPRFLAEIEAWRQELRGTETA
ncbi:MAG: RecQ family ATP-dependent DNA helicase [Lentisphaerae bacterium]|jgi:ATP-dependent DNA helicase RecQ|nr:RecQ family ATP-dependent DNA helicase [Lentisphaerota bacterium]MBT4818336.1 RecQ family ATP-dependent DNA helicase [Lentisphaerota bacterium]MBT5610699.1 RecQ family ATP-dependent DNA helicase [Lentisphaerota bacterium]MBT7844329.1 RecQ family ATP-dependent DNA helicase [Lentisphaerota bacterium]